MEIPLRPSPDDLGPLLRIKVLQLRHERCSASHITSVLDIDEKSVLAVLKDDQNFIDALTSRSSGQSDGSSLSKAELLDLRLREIAFKGTKKQVEDYNRKNFLRERLEEIPDYSGVDPWTFSFNKGNNFAYEIALVNQFRAYHLVRTKPDHTVAWIAHKCFQLLYEGFSPEVVDEIFEAPYTKGLPEFARHVNSKIDRRNTSILNQRIQVPSRESKITYAESLHLNSSSSTNQGIDFDFYMNINNGKGKVKSIRSIARKK